MSDTPTPAPPETGSTGDQQQPNQDPPETGDGTWGDLFPDLAPADVRKQLDHARTWETRAKSNAEAAQRLAEIEESQKTETQKAADRIKQLEGEVPAARLEAFKQAAVKFGGLAQEDADLFLTGTDMETLAKQAERLADRADERAKNGNRVPREGTNQPPVKSRDMRSVAAQVFGRD